MNNILAYLRNLAWLLFCLVLAIFIWAVASFQRDPLVQRSYIQVPIEFILPDGHLLIDAPRDTATVFVRAQQSVFEIFSRDYISLTADLREFGAGTQLVQLSARIQTEQAADIADISPGEITVELEAEVTREVAVNLDVSGETEIGYSVDEMNILPASVQVIGRQQWVEQVVAARATLLIHDREQSFDEAVAIFPIDAEGERVTGLRLAPDRVTVQVQISARDDVRQIAVRQPPLDFASLAWGYYPSSIQFEPEFILVSGTPAQLAILPDFLTTERVDLSDRTEDFQVELPIDIPAGLSVVDDQRMVTVSIGIAAQEGYRQYDAIPVAVVGLPDGLQAQVRPAEIAVFLAGPLPTLKNLRAEQLQAQIDASELAAGTHSVSPEILLPFTDLEVTSLSSVPDILELELWDAGAN